MIFFFFFSFFFVYSQCCFFVFLFFFSLKISGLIFHVWVDVFTQCHCQMQDVTQSIFKRSTASLNSGFSFFYISCLTEAKEPSLPYYLPITGERTDEFTPLLRISVKWNGNSFIMDLNSVDNHYTICLFVLGKILRNANKFLKRKKRLKATFNDIGMYKQGLKSLWPNQEENDLDLWNLHVSLHINLAVASSFLRFL